MIPLHHTTAPSTSHYHNPCKQHSNPSKTYNDLFPFKLHNTPSPQALYTSSAAEQWRHLNSISALSVISYWNDYVTCQNLSFFRDDSKSCNIKRSNQAHVDYTELLQHFDRVQSKHLEVRHQRSGRAEHTDRKLALWESLHSVPSWAVSRSRRWEHSAWSIKWTWTDFGPLAGTFYHVDVLYCCFSKCFMLRWWLLFVCEMYTPTQAHTHSVLSFPAFLLQSLTSDWNVLKSVYCSYFKPEQAGIPRASPHVSP